MRAPRLAVLLLSVLASACGGRMSRAEHAFDDGRHADAVDAFRALEADAHDLSPRAHARYALYRGLAHFACGDLRAAATWLAQARAASATDGSFFSVAEHGRLEAAWRSMGLMPGEPARITSGLPASVPAHSELRHASRSARPTSPCPDRR